MVSFINPPLYCNSITHDNFIVLKKIFHNSPLQSSLFPKLLAITDLFTISVILPLPECHINVVVSNDIFPLSSGHLRFIHVSV